jgi:hypothetical protein
MSLEGASDLFCLRSLFLFERCIMVRVKGIMKQNTEVNGQIKIESNVELPEPRNSIAATVKRMKVGDSIVVTMRQRNACFAAAYIQKIKLLSRTQEDDSARVWRVK